MSSGRGVSDCDPERWAQGSGRQEREVADLSLRPGDVKTLLQLLLAATVANLTLVATKMGLMRARGSRKCHLFAHFLASLAAFTVSFTLSITTPCGSARPCYARRRVVGWVSRRLRKGCACRADLRGPRSMLRVRSTSAMEEMLLTRCNRRLWSLCQQPRSSEQRPSAATAFRLPILMGQGRGPPAGVPGTPQPDRVVCAAQALTTAGLKASNCTSHCTGCLAVFMVQGKNHPLQSVGGGQVVGVPAEVALREDQSSYELATDEYASVSLLGPLPAV